MAATAQHKKCWLLSSRLCSWPRHKQRSNKSSSSRRQHELVAEMTRTLLSSTSTYISSTTPSCAPRQWRQRQLLMIRLCHHNRSVVINGGLPSTNLQHLQPASSVCVSDTGVEIHLCAVHEHPVILCSPQPICSPPLQHQGRCPKSDLFGCFGRKAEAVTCKTAG